ncbi:dynamin family protein [Kribbella sp. VKM Ac-2527]|uniref:Dynamin family protein n=1 Tax=Kribbella caucasensis TaxID=2512215 RepID=A0A4R6KER8_9ACTN|nr:dynamin family protein [Kribbella sp. VKM Ac-2527]TDO47218.1 dynamin family protein [Kribbella sp. VKM Ac-2527]
MITDSGAKGKGFWRRRRRKSEEPSTTPADSGRTPAETKIPEKAPEIPATEEPAAAEPVAATEEAASKPEDAGEPEDAKQPEQAEKAESGKDEEPDDTKSDEPAKAEKPAKAEEPVKAEEPTVGVVYEPDESPDGFPLEYGEIIVGLPKQPENGKQESDEPAEEAAEEAEEAPADQESAEDAPAEEQPATTEADEPADKPAEEPAAEAPDEAPAAEADETPADEPDESAAEADEAGDAADDVQKDQKDAESGSEAAASEQEAGEDVVPAEDAVPAEAEDTAADQQDDAPAGESDEPSEEGDASAEDGGAASDEGGEEDAEPEPELTPEQVAAKAAEQQAAMVLITALMKLRGALASSLLPLDVVGADEARQQQKAMLDQLDDYILPRLVQLEAPVLAVVGGSTGAGKSTLVNTLIGQVVSEPGVLRPTTRSPVLIHHPADVEWFTGDRVLPGMARSSGDRPGGMEDPGQIRLVAADTVPRGLAILDAPDIDSVVESNRELATQLLAAADLWLFVTTAARYADAVPWDFLQSASDRSTAVAVVLDRAPSDTIDDITGHLAQMLLERGLGDSPLFSVKETVVDEQGMLPAETVASIKDWLIDLAADAEARTAVVRRTLHGAVTAMTKKAPAFAKAVRDQADTAAELRTTAETAYERAVKDIAIATQDGTMLRGEVLARWQEFVGTGELLKGLQTNVGRVRDKVKAAVVGKPPPTRDLNDAVESGLESLLREHAEAAAERAEESWQSTAPGRQLLAAGDRDLGRMSKDFPAAAGRAVREWQGYVLDLVRKEGADKRSTARILAYGVNGLGLSLMVVIFASTAGVTGAEVGVGAGTAVVGQKLLEAVFGDQAVRTLAKKARENLDDRVHALMDAEFARYLAVLDQHPVDAEAPRQLTEAARAVEDCT